MDVSETADTSKGVTSSVIHSSIPEIRIRLGSDAPSIGEIKGTAPLASFESEGLSEGTSDLEDIDGEKGSNIFVIDELDRVTSPSLEVPLDLIYRKKCYEDTGARRNSDGIANEQSYDSYKDSFSMDEVTIVDTQQDSGEDVTPCASPPPPPPEENDDDDFHQNSYNKGDNNLDSLPAPPSKSPSVEEKGFGIGDSGVDDNFDTEDGETPVTTQNDDTAEEAEGEADVGYEVLSNEEGGDDPFDLSHIEKKCASEILGNDGNETTTTLHCAKYFMMDDADDITAGNIDEQAAPDFMVDNIGDINTFSDETPPVVEITDTEKEREDEKIKISIPHLKSRPKSPNRPPAPGISQSSSNSSVPPKLKGPARPPPPSAGKPGRPPPPNSKPPPPNSRPPPPKQSPRKNWETFEGSSSTPKRPPPPTKKSSKKGIEERLLAFFCSKLLKFYLTKCAPKKLYVIEYTIGYFFFYLGLS